MQPCRQVCLKSIYVSPASQGTPPRAVAPANSDIVIWQANNVAKRPQLHEGEAGRGGCGLFCSPLTRVGNVWYRCQLSPDASYFAERPTAIMFVTGEGTHGCGGFLSFFVLLTNKQEAGRKKEGRKGPTKKSMHDIDIFSAAVAMSLLNLEDHCASKNSPISS